MYNKYYLIFDLETVPLDWNSFSESQQEYLLRNTQTEEDILKKKSEMALTPLTAQIVCIGLQLMKFIDKGNYEMIKRAAFAVDNSMADSEHRLEELSLGDECHFYNEKTAIEMFWKLLKKYEFPHLISFNGRNFDAPFLMLRSAILGMRPDLNLMSGTKFSYDNHTDLIDELTFFSPSSYGATKRFNFDFYTRAFGITSPKSEGIDGSKVKDYYLDGRIKEISEYCLRDVKATWELYLKWVDLLKFR